MTKKEEKRIFTVSELTRNIRMLLEEAFPTIWVEGEVSNLTKHQSGHMYFSIKDPDSVLSCVMFRRANAGLKFELKGGMHILCFGKISVYDKRGQYQLYVEQIEPKGAGALQIAFEQLKEKLKNEGLFDEAHKKPIPYLPQKVGVITSATGAAIRDILNVAKRRFSNIEIILNPVTVQGETAKHDIAEAISLFNKLQNIDVIIVGRGGGSLEDLWPFNEEIVARAIYASEIPIISAVGHEIDWTISDFVADFRAPTPSAAAELIIPKKEDLVATLKTLSERMRLSLLSHVESSQDKLSALINRYVFRQPSNIIVQHEQEIDDLTETLFSQGALNIKFKQEKLNTLMAKLGALSPLAILNRGYSITVKSKNNKAIKDSSTVKKNDFIITRLAKGEIKSRVEKTTRDREQTMPEDLWQK